MAEEQHRIGRFRVLGRLGESRKRQLSVPPRRAPRVVAGALAASVLVLSATASGAPGWSSPVSISAAGGDIFSPNVATDQSGNVVAVWERDDGDTVIEVAYREASRRRWRQPVRVSPVGHNGFTPVVGVDARGNAAVVWDGYDGENDRVEASVRSAASGRSTTRILSQPGVDADDSDLAVARNGLAIAIWQENTSDQSVLRASIGNVRTESWSPPVAVSPPGEVALYSPRVAVDAAGNAIVVWLADGAAGTFVRARLRSHNGVWGPLRALSGVGATIAVVGVSPSGKAIAVWEQNKQGRRVIQASESSTSPASSWSQPTDVSAVTSDSYAPRVAIGADGRVILIWAQQRSETAYVVQSAVRATGDAGWGAPQDVSAPERMSEPAALGLDRSGNALVVWEGFDGVRTFSVRASRRAADTGEWAPPRLLSARGGGATGPAVAFDPAGNATVVWAGAARPQGRVVQAVGYDAAGPVLARLRIPKRARARRPIRMSVAPFDVWSSLPFPPTWSFGDRTPVQRGTLVTHAFRAPGRYTVTVTQADRLGNVTSRRAQLVVRPQ